MQDANLVIFAGDMVDYVSSTTIECLKQGMQEIEAPILYIRSDHDYHVGWSDDLEKDDNYVPNAVTQKFLDMVYEKDSPVKAVVAAHLHFAYDVQLTKDIPEYVFAPSYEGNIGIIEIKPEEK